MINKIKAYAIAIGTILATILTLGGYAKYQKHRADKAEREAEENKRIAEQAEMIQEQINKKQQQNNEANKKHHKNIRNRTFFGKYNSVRK